MSAFNHPYAKQADHYKKNQIETATPTELLIMLYEGAIRFLLIAKKAHETNDLEKFHNHLLKAQHIIQEFMNSLDMEVGGEMAENLIKLYEYLNYQLVQANIKKDIALIDEVLFHLRQLKATWEEAISIALKEQNNNNPEIDDTIKHQTASVKNL
ncbi:MAG: flagellar export chaperone FliS [Cyanobacteria bacterium P01_H01_bin.74]